VAVVIMNAVANAIDHILRSASDEKCAEIEALIEEHGWRAIDNAMRAILMDDSRERDWPTCAEVYWGAALDARELDVDEVIALLLHRLERDEDGGENNLVWSIISKLKNKSYLSAYNAREDAGVRAALARFSK
jgi:hypothetical protein